MSELTAVDRLFGEAVALVELLKSTPEVSLQLTAADHLRKALLLAAASHFERRISDVVLHFVRERANGSPLVENFVRNKAIARQYHTWFQWDGTNANQFFGLFGDSFKSMMTDRIKTSSELQLSIKAFLEVGGERNRLVHQDYATFAMEKTLDEVYQLYRTALKFVEALPSALRDCDRAGPV
jgi:hypothetical protein